jgi:hypothetical protein
MRSRLFFSCLALLFLTTASAGLAADAGENAFKRIATPVNPVTLQAEGLRITLWGVRPVGDPAIDLKATDLLDNMIGSAAITCRAIGGTSTDTVARCSDHADEDLGLELLNRGYVVVDRRQDVSSVPAYMEAQKAAHRNAVGIWRQVEMGEKAGVPVWLQIIMGASPVAGLLLVAFVMYYRLKRLETQQQEEREHTQRKENQLVVRERHVLVSTLEGELTENKNRVEAFLTIYGAMLENLQSKTEKPKYQQSGDIVQKHPSLSKTVFETSTGKFSLLDMKLAAQISKLYAALPKEQEYVNIEPGVPIESARALVEKVMREAEALIPPITAVITALDEIIASSRKFEA